MSKLSKYKKAKYAPWWVRTKILRAYYNGEDVVRDYDISKEVLDEYIKMYEPSKVVYKKDYIPVYFGSKREPYYETEEEYLNMPVNNYLNVVTE